MRTDLRQALDYTYQSARFRRPDWLRLYMSTTADEAGAGKRSARNIANRPTLNLSARHVGRIIAAVDCSLSVGLKLNRFATFHLEKAGVTDPVKAISRYLRQAATWVGYHGGTFAYVWVRENGVGKGDHVHILMHVEARLQGRFRKLEREWKSRAGIVQRKGLRRVCRTRPVGRRLIDYLALGPGSADYKANLMAVRDYLLKGATQSVLDRFGIVRKSDGDCRVVGRRYGVSQSLTLGGAISSTRRP